MAVTDSCCSQTQEPREGENLRRYENAKHCHKMWTSNHASYWWHHRSDINSSMIFSMLDLNSSYHQLELEPTSRYITTFSSHIGVWRYKRLNFGTSSAAEIFQNTIRLVINAIPGVINISNDVLVHGKKQKQHDIALTAVFKWLRDYHLTLNPEKCVFNKGTLEFFGHGFPPSGMKADPKKIVAINQAPPPENVSELWSLVGMSSYSSRYIADYATYSQLPCMNWLKKRRSVDVLRQTTTSPRESRTALLTIFHATPYHARAHGSQHQQKNTSISSPGMPHSKHWPCNRWRKRQQLTPVCNKLSNSSTQGNGGTWRQSAGILQCQRWTLCDTWQLPGTQGHPYRHARYTTKPSAWSGTRRSSRPSCYVRRFGFLASIHRLQNF